MENVEFQLQTPEYEGPVLKFDIPWEGVFSIFTTILKDDNLYRAYYRGWNAPGESEVTSYAESNDGKTWRKPDLEIYEVNGTLKINVILANAGRVTHNFSPFIDKNPEANPKHKYKALGGLTRSGLTAYVSEDGIHWEKLKTDPVITEGAFDSQNVAFWSESEGSNANIYLVIEGFSKSNNCDLAMDDSTRFIRVW